MSIRNSEDPQPESSQNQRQQLKAPAKKRGRPRKVKPTEAKLIKETNIKVERQATVNLNEFGRFFSIFYWVIRKVSE
jgi:hypothetical protein